MKNNKSKTVLQYFNSIAGKYDFLNSFLSFGLHHLWKRNAVKTAALKQGDRVLDVCGGTADLSMLAAKAVGDSGRVTLYDFSPEMIHAGMAKISKTSFVHTVNFVCGDAEEIAAPDNSFDAALIGFGLRNLSDMAKGLREIHRVVKPGGKLVCLEFSRPVFPWLRWLYDIYSFYVIPFAGKVFSGSSDAYNYLPLSIRKFPLPEKLSSIMQNVGFSNIIFKKLTNGIAVIHAATKI